ncbi:hypothetical protein [Shimia abyssi]|uniref:hypothetical protein n=1 Tax=Shimia abyssi TaxID=1662395 RepID=UPI0013FDB816|nr:hypothetical protein [Shimia abyssi]
MTSQKLGKLRTTFAIISHHLNGTRRWLISHRCLENWPISTADWLATIIKRKVIIRQAFSVNRDLNQLTILTIEGRPNTLENINMNAVGGNARTARAVNGGLKTCQCGGVKAGHLA